MENGQSSEVEWSFFMMMMFPKKSVLGQVVVGGTGKGGIDTGWGNFYKSVELFPRPPSDTCSIPDLPEPRYLHSLSLLSGGRLVVCGGKNASREFALDSCLSWVAGNVSWTPIFTMR